MRRIADTQKTRPGPLRKPVDGNRKKTDVLPVRQFFHPVAQEWRQLGDIFAESWQPALPDSIGLAFGNDESALPIALAIDHHKNLSPVEVAQSLARIRGAPAYPHPHHIHGSAEIDHLEVRTLTDNRVPSVSANTQRGANFQ